MLSLLFENSPRLRWKRRNHSGYRRRGGMLLEVLLATSILLVAIAVLGNQCGVGVRAGIRAQIESESIWHCQSILNETVASSERKPTTKPTSVPSHDDWLFTVEFLESGIENVDLVRVSVWKQGNMESLSKSHLNRLIRKPLPAPARVEK